MRCLGIAQTSPAETKVRYKANNRDIVWRSEITQHYLFICSKNQWRSPTAEALFANIVGVEAISAGTNHDAETPLTGDLIEWADIIYVMERKHAQNIKSRFANLLQSKPLHVLGIADNYQYMDDKLIEIIKNKFPNWFRNNAS